ncbi:unnamed protein product, partial [Amoebophrya sp. A25]
GVSCLVFAEAARKVISGGFDNQLLVWNPYTGNSRAVADKRHHTSAIVDVVLVTPRQFLSADQGGAVKTWDLFSFTCLQSWTIGGDLFPVSSVCSLPENRRVIVAASRFYAYDYEQSLAAEQTDEWPLCRAVYSPGGHILTGAGPCVRIWNAERGTLLERTLRLPARGGFVRDLVSQETNSSDATSSIFSRYLPSKRERPEHESAGERTTSEGRGTSERPVENSSNNVHLDEDRHQADDSTSRSTRTTASTAYQERLQTRHFGADDSIISDFCVDTFARRVYVADQVGRIGVFNALT